MNSYICLSDNSERALCAQSRFVEFDDYRIWGSGARAFIDELISRAESKQSTLAFYINAHTYNLAASNKYYREMLSGADLLYPDGASIVGACALAGCGTIPRMTAVDFFDAFCDKAADAALKLYILASRPDVMELAYQRLTELHANLQIVGYCNGYIENDAQRDRILADINSKAADVLLVGMGSPLQENFAWDNRNALDVSVIWTVGALMDYYADVEKPAPRWLARCGFEWLYRLYQDPAGKWKRYLVGNPAFAARAIAAAVKSRFKERA